MTAADRAARGSGVTAADRVLVLWCPDWPAGASAGVSAAGAQAEDAAGAREFEQVVAAVEEFCPRVEVLCPGACAIGTRGPARYFGGEQVLARKLVEAVTGRGIACQAGIAEGLFAARLAARAGAPGAVIVVPPRQTREFLAAHPVSVLGIEELTGLLPRLGIGTLGEFAALPATEAVNRFGAAGALGHRLARGLDPRPLVTRAVPAGKSVAMEFDPPAQLAEPVVFAAKALAMRMHAGLSSSGLACVRVAVRVTWADGREVTRLWRHDGLLSALAVAERVRWQLAAIQEDDVKEGSGQEGSGQDGGCGVGGITELRLVPDQLVADHGRQLGLWGDAVVSDRVARAALRVQAMLGHGAVTRPVPAGGRGPDQVLLVPFGDAAEPALPAGRPWPGRIPAPGPATVCPDPLPAEIADCAGDAVTVTGRAQVSAPPAWVSVGGGPWLEVSGWAGPWPVAERWWQPSAACRRARFQLLTEDGTGWLAALHNGHWLIEATYD